MAVGGLAIAAACALTAAGAPVPPAIGTVPAARAQGWSVHTAASLSHSAGRQDLKSVRYLGYSFRVPSSWPVFDDRARADSCVRFDQHAVYLGAAPADESCPSWLLGTTEAILIEAGPAHAQRSATENEVARQVIARAPGVIVLATFDTDPALIDRILASAGWPAPAIQGGRSAGSRPGVTASWSGARGRAPGGAALASRAGQYGSRTASRVAPPPLPDAVASYRGLGFDACAAPSTRVMAAWHSHSPYRTIGIYVGGSDRACAQPNLNQSWVRAEAMAGWHFIPMYAGPQAEFREIHAPVRQGVAAARDAVTAMRRLGFGRWTPVYYDMEAFRRRSRAVVLAFLSAWTAELHKLGYASGVYSSSDSGIVDLSREYSRRTYAMPNVIYDALWNGSRTTTDRHLRLGQWHSERIHQFRGNITQRFGGHTINVDLDILDVRVSSPAVTSQATSAVTLPDGSVDLFYRKGGERIWFDRLTAAGGWGKPVRTRAESTAAPSVVWTGSAVDVFYKGRDGRLWVISYRPGGARAGQRELSMMGIIGSAPRAVAQPGGIVDVFWHGSADDHLWHAQYVRGTGWSGPQNLGGNLLSWPAPVASAPGRTTVLWEGTDKNLWFVTRGLSGRWSAPRSAGMGPLGGSPRATAQPGGGIEVYWHGSGNSKVWEGFYQPGKGWLGPKDLGGTAASAPWPATAAGTVRVLWRGRGHALTYITHRVGQVWRLTGWRAPFLPHLGWLGSAPFAAAGDPGAQLRIFWYGRRGSVWTAVLRRSAWVATRLVG